MRQDKRAGTIHLLNIADQWQLQPKRWQVVTVGIVLLVGVVSFAATISNGFQTTVVPKASWLVYGMYAYCLHLFLRMLTAYNKRLKQEKM